VEAAADEAATEAGGGGSGNVGNCFAPDIKVLMR